jgi:hypothetical protein
MNITDISITSDDIITETSTNGNITEENFKATCKQILLIMLVPFMKNGSAPNS